MHGRLLVVLHNALLSMYASLQSRLTPERPRPPPVPTLRSVLHTATHCQKDLRLPISALITSAQQCKHGRAKKKQYFSQASTF